MDSISLKKFRLDMQKAAAFTINGEWQPSYSDESAPIHYKEIIDMFDTSEALTFLRNMQSEKKKELKSVEYKEKRMRDHVSKYDEVTQNFLIAQSENGGIAEYRRRLLADIKHISLWIRRYEYREAPELSRKHTEVDFDYAHNTPILDVVRAYGVASKKSGSQHSARCPFPDHNEKTASFFINEKKNVCYCWGCHKGGDPISFISHMENISKLDAAKRINSSF